jgi:glutathione S-transferase
VLECHGGAVILADSDLILDEIGNVVQGGSILVPDNEKTQKDVQQFRDSLSQFLPIGKIAVLGGDKEKMWTKLRELDALVQGPYICGEETTVADCAAFPFLWRINDEFGSLGKQGCPNIQKWLGACSENPAFSKTVQGSWWWWW